MDDKNNIQQEQQHTAETPKEKPKKPMQLTQAIREQAREEDSLPSASYTLRKILGGDFLTADVMRKQTALEAVSLGAKSPVGGWFMPFGRYVYVPLCVIALVAGAILGGIG